MNKDQELLFNTIFKDIDININFLKDIFIYACNIYSNINKININLIIEDFYKTKFEYKKNISYNLCDLKFKYNFKYFTIIKSNYDIKIKLDNILNKKFVFLTITSNYINNFKIIHYLIKNNILYITYKYNHYIDINYNLINNTVYSYIKKFKYINNISIYKILYSSLNFRDFNENKYYLKFIYLSNNRLKRLKIYNYYNKAKEISLIKYKSQIYYNYYNNIFNDNRNIIFFDSFYTTNKIKTLIL